MLIDEIYKDHLFAVKFEDECLNEMEKAMDLWGDEDKLINFFEENKNLLNTIYWRVNLPSIEPQYLAYSIIAESVKLWNYIKQLCNNTSKGQFPDLDSHFHRLDDSRYIHLTEYVPQKSFGLNYPSMIRLYAIRLFSNCYIIVHGGLKLTHEIKGTPILNKELFPKIDNIIRFLKTNGIIDNEDLIE